MSTYFVFTNRIIWHAKRDALSSAMRRSLSRLYREERHLLFRSSSASGKGSASSRWRIETLSPMQGEGVSLLCIEMRDALSPVERKSLPPLYREERETLCRLQKEGVSLLSIEKRDVFSLASSL